MSSRSHGGEVVVGTDGSPHGDAALDWAAAEAYRRGARLHVVHAWRASPPPIPPLAPPPAVSGPDTDKAKARCVLDRAVARVLDACSEEPPDVCPHLVEGSPRTVLIDMSGDANLLVVGSRGRSRFVGLLSGSVSRAVVGHAACPVVVVPPPMPRLPSQPTARDAGWQVMAARQR
jgi:nucleotide-binding universal stress UspA family protein